MVFCCPLKPLGFRALCSWRGFDPGHCSQISVGLDWLSCFSFDFRLHIIRKKVKYANIAKTEALDCTECCNGPAVLVKSTWNTCRSFLISPYISQSNQNLTPGGSASLLLNIYDLESKTKANAEVWKCDLHSTDFLFINVTEGLVKLDFPLSVFEKLGLSDNIFDNRGPLKLSITVLNEDRSLLCQPAAFPFEM